MVWCGSQFCGGCWCGHIVCGGAWLGLAFGVGVVRECFVPTYGCSACTPRGRWLVVGGRVFGAGVSWYGGRVVWSWRVVGGVFGRAHLRGVFWWWLAGWWVWRFGVLGGGLAGGRFHVWGGAQLVGAGTFG